MEKLDGWVFTYSEAGKLWSAAKREDYHLLFNDFNSPKVLRSKEFDTLQRLIIKTDGDPARIKRVVSSNY